MRVKAMYATIILLILLLCSLLFQLRHQKRLAASNILALTDSVTYYRNRLGTQTASVHTLRVDERVLQRELINKDKKLKALSSAYEKVTSLVVHSEVTRIDTISINYPHIIPCDFASKGNVRDKWYGFNYSADTSGINITDLNFRDTTVVMTGIKRKWLLGGEILVTEVTHSSPYVQTGHIRAGEVVVPSPWYKKWYIWFAAGLAGGLLLK